MLVECTVRYGFIRRLQQLATYQSVRAFQLIVLDSRVFDVDQAMRRNPRTKCLHILISSGSIVMTNIKNVVLGLILGVCIVCSSAYATTYEADYSGVEMPTPGSFDWNVSTIGGEGRLNFRLVGYDSLDGAGPYGNWYRDIFHLAINGIEIFTGSFNMGGIGDDEIYHNPSGGKVSTTNFGFFLGGFSDISIPVLLDHSGNQLISFNYTGNLQEPGDEAWGVNKVQLAIPEPATWAILLLGLGLIERRQQNRIYNRYRPSAGQNGDQFTGDPDDVMHYDNTHPPHGDIGSSIVRLVSVASVGCAPRTWAGL
jgi:hypothetical protein